MRIGKASNHLILWWNKSKWQIDGHPQELTAQLDPGLFKFQWIFEVAADKLTLVGLESEIPANLQSITFNSKGQVLGIPKPNFSVGTLIDFTGSLQISSQRFTDPSMDPNLIHQPAFLRSPKLNYHTITSQFTLRFTNGILSDFFDSNENHAKPFQQNESP